MTKAISYIEIDIPFCANTYGIAPCTASLTSSPPTGTRKCFNTPNTCQDRANYIDAPVTLRFAMDSGLIAEAGIDCIPSIDQISFTPAVVSLGKDLGTRASLSVTFHDHRWPDTGPGFDKYLSERPYNPFAQGTFWGKFRARQPFLRGRPMRLIQGVVGQTLAEMETRHFLIDSFTHSAEDGTYQIVAKDLIKFADDDRAQAPKVSQGFIVADITASASSLQLSPSGIGDEEYPATGYVTLGGKEVVAFERDPTSGNDSNTKLLIHCDGTAGSTAFSDASSGAKTVSVSGNTQVTTTQKKYGTGAALFDGSGDQLFLSDHADWTPSGNFTIDFWFRPASLAAVMTLFLHSTDANNRYFLQTSTAGALTFSVVSAGVAIVTMTTANGVIVAAPSGFYHCAVVRNGNDWRIYINGVSVANTTDSDAIPNFTSFFRLGIDQAGGTSFNGAIDEFRFSHVARWTANFTPPVAAFQTTGDLLSITRAQFTTEAQSHSAQDRVQLVLIYDVMDVADIIYDLLVNYAGVDPSYIPLAAWKDETSSFLDRVFSATIAEPVGVASLINELIEDAALSIWWDDITPELSLRVLRPIATDAFSFDENNYMKGTFSSREQPNERISQVWRFFAKRSPVERQDNDDNYRSVAVTIDLQAETDYGSPVIHKIHSRWIPFGGRSIADKANSLYISRYRDPPRMFQFSVFRNDLITPELGLGYRLGGMGLQDDIGQPLLTPIQITRLNPTSSQFDIEAQEMLVSGSPTDLINRVVVIDSNVNNVNLKTLHDSLYPVADAQDVIDGVNLTCIIDAGVIIGGINAFGPSRSFDVGTGWPTGFPITIINNGTIQGGGGKGGAPNGQQGGTGIYTRVPIDLELPSGSKLWGGGGGGGRGAVRFSQNLGYTCGCGGGGGAGTVIGTASLGVVCNGVAADPGDNGTATTGGAGGSGSGTNSGGAGGNPGLAGGAGASGGAGDIVLPAGTAGAAGNSIDGVSFVTVTVNLGDVRGPQIN